jgi:hypothetical protein
MLRGQLKRDHFNKVPLARRFYLIEFVAPEGELRCEAHPWASPFGSAKVDQIRSFGCPADLSCAPRSCAPCRYSPRVAVPLATRFIHEAPFGLLTRHIPVPRPLGAMHANRLSCRFASAKAAVLGATNGMKPHVRNISGYKN